jgi:hypothetical protein
MADQCLVNIEHGPLHVTEARIDLTKIPDESAFPLSSSSSTRGNIFLDPFEVNLSVFILVKDGYT